MSELKQCGACPGCAAQCRHQVENPPASDGEVEVLATLVLGGAFDSDELGDCDIEWDSGAVEALQQKLVKGFDDVHIELVDRAHVTRLQAALVNMREERDILQRKVDNFDRTTSGIPALARAERLQRQVADLKASLETVSQMCRNEYTNGAIKQEADEALAALAAIDAELI